MKRLGNVLSTLTIFCLVLFTAPFSAHADPIDSTGLVCVPTISLPADSSLRFCEPESVCFDVVVDNPGDADTLTLTLLDGPIQFPDEVLLSDSARTVCFTPETSGDYRFVWQVANQYGNVDTDTLVYSIYFNIPPVIEDQQFSEHICFAPYTRLLPVSACDPDCDTLVYLLLSGPGSIDRYTGVITYDAQGSGVTTFEVAAVDECGSDTAVVTDSIYLNQKPWLTVHDYVYRLCAPEEICFDVIGYDPEGSPLVIHQIEGQGQFTPLTDSSGQTCFMPGNADSTTYRFVYCLVDECPYNDTLNGTDDLPTCDQDTVFVTVIIDQPPVLTCPEEKRFFVCDAGTFCFDIEALDPEESPLTFSVLSGNAEIDGNTVCLVAEQAGAFDVVVAVADSCGHADTCTIPVTVDMNRTPYVTTADDFSVSPCVPEAICFDASADDLDFNIESLIVNYGYYDKSSNRICFDTDTSGVYTITLTAVDSCGATDVDTTVVTVHINGAPVVDLGDDFAVMLCDAEPVCADVTIADDNTRSLYLNLGTFNEATGQVCFTPDASGVYEIIARLTDDCGLVAEDTLLVTVDYNSPPVISGLNDTAVFLCNPRYICLPVSIDDPDGDIIGVTVNRGTYANGTICFVPYDSGQYRIAVTVTDSCGHVVTDTAVVTVTTEQGLTIDCPNDTSIFLCEPDTLCFPVGNIPAGAEVSVSGTAAWWNPETQSVCFYSDCCLQNTLTVSVTTDCRTYTCSFTVHVQTNSSPLVIVPQDTTVFQCEPQQICLPVGVDDLDKNVTGVVVDGAEYDDYRSLMCFTPDTVGTYIITVTATDECGATDQDQIAVTVELNRPPLIQYDLPEPTVRQCELAEICIPTDVTDLDGNIVNVTVDGGVWNADAHAVCFTPDSFGEHCLTVIAVDECGLADTAQFCLTVEQGQFIEVYCTTFDNPIELCQPGEISLPIGTSGGDFQITTSYGEYRNGMIFMYADTSGVYDITIIATAECNADTCTMNVPVEIAEPVTISCPSDTAIFFCDEKTVAFGFVASSSVSEVTASAPAYVQEDSVYVPFAEAGTQTITLIGTGFCGADTCSFTVEAVFNEPPLITADDVTMVLCELSEICLPVTVTDPNNYIASVTSSMGEIVEGQLCFTPEQFGEYEIVITARDYCAAEAIDTVTVTVLKGDFVDITCPTVEPLTLCEQSLVCFPVEILGTNFTVATSYGAYEDGEICFQADTTGRYAIEIIGDAGCNSDTCLVTVDVTIKQPASVVCKVSDTSVFLCEGPKTLQFPVLVTGDDVTVAVSPDNAVYNNGIVSLTVSESGTYTVEVIAENFCNADTCSFTVEVGINQPPILSGTTDTSLIACELSEICLPFSVSDPDNNLTEVRATLGLVNDTILCFTPSAFGDYRIVVTAVDECGETVKDTINVSVAEGEFAVIDCPTFTIPVAVETPDTVRIPIAVSPVDAAISVSPFGYYDVSTGEVVAYIETPGTYTFEIVADAYCSSDTCQFKIDISQYFPPTVQCIGSVDTVMCLTEQQGFCMPVSVFGTDVQVAVNPIGQFMGDSVCFPIDTTGEYVIEIIAFNEFSADTCYATVTVGAGDPPMVRLPGDFATFLCDADEVCVPLSIDRVDFGIKTVSVNYGTYDPQTGDICALLDTAGTYMIYTTVTDSCGYYAADTIYITADMNLPPVVDLGDDVDLRLCQPELVCLDVSIADQNLTSVVSNIGDYNAETGLICFMADSAGTYLLTLKAVDECGLTVEDTALVSVEMNSAPTISPMRDTTVYLCYPQYICLPVGVYDVDDNIASIKVNRGQYSDGKVCFVPYDSGNYKIILTVTDECGLKAVDTAIVTVRTDQGIVVDCPNDTSVFLCEPDTLCFPVGGIPEGATVKVGGTATWWDEDNHTVCFYSDCCLENIITVSVTTACGTYSCQFTVRVQTNSSPLVIIPQDTTIVQCELKTVCLPIGVNDIDKNLSDIVVEGAVYDAYRGVACLTPDQPGTYVVKVTAYDSCGASDVDNMTVVIVENREPAVSFTAVDTMLQQCMFEEVCLPVVVEDLDHNISTITVSHGEFDSENGQVCFQPDSFGVYCITVTAVDACGLSATDEHCIRVAVGDYVSIECPDGELPTDTICEAGSVCVPLAITGDNFTTESSLGSWVDGEVCFQADTSGLYEIRVIATAMCGADTCLIAVPVKILEDVYVYCPSDQAGFMCGPDTVCYSFTVSSSVTDLIVSAPAYITGEQICVPVLEEGTVNVTMIATGKCGADTCSFSVTGDFNAPPVIVDGRDTSLIKCELSQICLPLSVSDEDDNLMEVTTTLGTVNTERTQVCFTPPDYGVYDIIILAVDECGASNVDTVRVSYLEGAYASIICPEDDQFASLCGPDTVCIVVPIEPADANITILPNGKYKPETGEICVYVTADGTVPVTVIAEAQCGSDTCEFNLQIDLGIPPVVTCPESIDTLLCLADPTTLCFPVEVSGTGVEVNVNPVGAYSAGIVCVPINEPGDYDFEIIAFGACGTDTCHAAVTVRADQFPQLFLPQPMAFERCPDDTDIICINGIYATDAEDPVTITQVCGMDGAFEAVRADSGGICFLPDGFGTFEFCFEATDGCHTVVDTMTVDITLKDNCEVCARLWIDPGDCTPVGLRKTVAINVDVNDAIAGLDLLLSYDASAVTFIGASKAGGDIEGWEYFTYNLNNGACGTACPSGLVRLIGIADINNGGQHPPDSAYTPDGTLAFIEFQVANDQNLGSQFVPIKFVWYDCGDNTLSDRSGTLLYMDLRIFNAEEVLIWDEENDAAFPDASRTFGMGSPDECLVGTEKTQPYRCIEFVNGGICIIDPKDIDDRGDINLDGLAYTIADAVMFTNYFIHGLSAFTISIPGQIAATDVNADGLTLSVADLAYLIRVIVGDADPIPKLNPYEVPLNLTTTTDGGRIAVTTDAVSTIGAAYLVYDVDGVSIDGASLTAATRGMDLMYSVTDGKLKVLLFNIGTGKVDVGKHEIFELAYSGNGSISLSHVEIVDYNGRPYQSVGKNSALPGDFTLNQNYPNPFNPSTTISFTLPSETSWRLRIFNINGKLVREYDGSGEAGTVEVDWDGRSTAGEATASGVYLYRLEAGSFSATRKMILLK